MSRYRKVDPRIWNDAKFTGLSNNGKLVFFFLLTHPNMTALGAMRGTIPGLAAEIGWSDKAFREALREALARGMVKHSEKDCFFLFPNFLKYNRPESPNVVKAWVGSVDLLPECNLLCEAITNACECAEGMGEAFREALPKAFAEALAKSMPYQEQEQEQEQEIICVSNDTHCRASGPTAAVAPKNGNDKKQNKIPYTVIVSMLNEVCGCQFKADVRATKDHIRARWNEGWRLADFEAVIKAKAEEWGGDEKMCKFLRPQTLFGSKFEGYLQAAKIGGNGGFAPRKTPDQDRKERIDQEMKRLLNGENPFIFAQREGVEKLNELRRIAEKAANGPNTINS